MEKGDMLEMEKLNIGVVGVGGRAYYFKDALLANKHVKIHAICDIKHERLQQVMNDMGASEKYDNYDEMLEKSDLDAVMIGTPMDLHASQVLKALRKNLHVLSEIPAGISIDECRELVAAGKKSKGQYMMGENCNYMKPYMVIAEMVRKGLFGDVYYAEGEYIHEVRELFEITKWRRKWQSGINGITYGTHSIGPILSWMPEDRICRVSCEGSGHHYTDPRGDEYEQEDTCVMLAKTEKGRLIKIRLDMLSNRPPHLNYSLQGTKGCYESAKFGRDIHRIWLEDLCESREEWLDLDTLADQHLPENMKDIGQDIFLSSHDGSDYIMVNDFINSIYEMKPCRIGIHAAMDLTLPGLISQQSIARKGEWLEVPDSRGW
jgi:predicted dehydrogenase